MDKTIAEISLSYYQETSEALTIEQSVQNIFSLLEAYEFPIWDIREIKDFAYVITKGGVLKATFRKPEDILAADCTVVGIGQPYVDAFIGKQTPVNQDVLKKKGPLFCAHSGSFPLTMYIGIYENLQSIQFNNKLQFPGISPNYFSNLLHAIDGGMIAAVSREYPEISQANLKRLPIFGQDIFTLGLWGKEAQVFLAEGQTKPAIIFPSTSILGIPEETPVIVSNFYEDVVNDFIEEQVAKEHPKMYSKMLRILGANPRRFLWDLRRKGLTLIQITHHIYAIQKIPISDHAIYEYLHAFAIPINMGEESRHEMTLTKLSGTADQKFYARQEDFFKRIRYDDFLKMLDNLTDNQIAGRTNENIYFIERLRQETLAKLGAEKEKAYLRSVQSRALGRAFSRKEEVLQLLDEYEQPNSLFRKRGKINVLTHEQVVRARQLAQEEYSISAIERELGFKRDGFRNAIGLSRQAKTDKDAKRPSRNRDFSVDQIALIEEGIQNGTPQYEMLGMLESIGEDRLRKFIKKHFTEEVLNEYQQKVLNRQYQKAHSKRYNVSAGKNYRGTFS